MKFSKTILLLAFPVVLVCTVGCGNPTRYIDVSVRSGFCGNAFIIPIPDSLSSDTTTVKFIFNDSGFVYIPRRMLINKTLRLPCDGIDYAARSKISLVTTTMGATSTPLEANRKTFSVIAIYIYCSADSLDRSQLTDESMLKESSRVDNEQNRIIKDFYESGVFDFSRFDDGRPREIDSIQ